MGTTLCRIGSFLVIIAIGGFSCGLHGIKRGTSLPLKVVTDVERKRKALEQHSTSGTDSIIEQMCIRAE